MGLKPIPDAAYPAISRTQSGGLGIPSKAGNDHVAMQPPPPRFYARAGKGAGGGIDSGRGQGERVEIINIIKVF